MKPANSNMTGNASGHSEKSATMKPVVVITVTTSNAA